MTDSNLFLSMTRLRHEADSGNMPGVDPLAVYKAPGIQPFSFISAHYSKSLALFLNNETLRPNL